MGKDRISNNEKQKDGIGEYRQLVIFKKNCKYPDELLGICWDSVGKMLRMRCKYDSIVVLCMFVSINLYNH